MKFQIIFILGFLSLVLVLLLFINENTRNVVLEDSRELIIIPVKVQIVNSESERYTSLRSEEDVQLLFDETNRIWRQAGIYFSLEDVVITRVERYDIQLALNEDYSNIVNNENYDKEKINLLFVGSLNGLNGLSWLQGNVVFISDNTEVNTSRVLAHEFGHLLGLKHVEGEDNLMAQGYGGEMLSGWEIEIAREDGRNFKKSIKIPLDN